MEKVVRSFIKIVIPLFVRIGLSPTAFMIEYVDVTKFDIAIGPKQVDIFDDYYDKYRQDFRT